MTRLIIFDIDGTIVDAYKAIEVTLNYALGRMGYPVAGPLRVRRAVGYGDRNFIIRFVKHKDVQTALELYRKRHKSDLLKYARPLPEAKRVLGLLKKRGYKLAIASNRPGKFSAILLKHLDMEKYFDMIICARNVNEIKPKPKLLLDIMDRLKVPKDETLYVGDMTIDVMAGRNAGVKTAAVLGGSSYKYELEKLKPFRIISRLSDLLKIA